ncbi:hypothetical protein NEOLEDRAFT_1144074 [Neolentinus lepideus HHB14362 ss-1]|uniref:YDG domain-containing protein n=1 Tax=Neolentinus lepideus HHB14362 ss-1 TaxID=1314782 RepID=A0A165VYY3_9AGAM|nr:hypothetical protein NEOLEDRAFT_1144074 [Neolentinus lepideus HHB14362 ss-1]
MEEETADIELWERLLGEQTALFCKTTAENAELRARVNELEREVSVWKLAYKTADEEKSVMKQSISKLERSIGSLKDDNPLITCLIDGDGHIFSQELLSKGRGGGRQAAMLLTKGIMTYMHNDDGATTGRSQLWLTIYCNKSGLLETLVNYHICTAEQFESFVLGFNQASPLFSIVDVGSGKEAADAKIKGGHDNGYTSTLNYLQNEGLFEKIVLLRGYRDIASELKSLNLPDLEIDGIFMPRKLSSTLPRKKASTPPSLIQADDFERMRASPRSSSSPLTMSPKQNSRKFLRYPDSTLPINKQKPPPCNFYYLAECKSGDRCRYGHDYILTHEHLDEIRINSKKSPCPMINRNQICPKGNNCCMGHYCPRGAKCSFLKQGKCKFTGILPSPGADTPEPYNPGSPSNYVYSALLYPANMEHTMHSWTRCDTIDVSVTARDTVMYANVLALIDPALLPHLQTLYAMVQTLYEVQRQKNIDANSALLQQMGLEVPFFPKEKPRKRSAAPKKRMSASAGEDNVDGENRPAKTARTSSDNTTNTEGPRRSARNAGKKVDYKSEQLTAASRPRLISLKSSDSTMESDPGRSDRRVHDPRTYGSIPGIEVNTWWETRKDCSIDAIHAPWVAGIAPGPKGAFSIALSGGYEDDVDLGYGFTYTGSGGRDLKGTKTAPKNLRTAPQSSDQTFENNFNAALKTSCETKKPVRVIRGFKLRSMFAPAEGYRYDGLYTVEKAWMEKGLNPHGYLVCKFAFKRIPGQPPIPTRDDSFEEEAGEAKSRKAMEVVQKDNQTEGQGELNVINDSDVKSEGSYTPANAAPKGDAEN